MSPGKTKVKLTHSLRGRLLWYLLAAITIAAVAQASIAYRSALADADQIFDYHMQQMALSLRSRVPLANSEEAGNVDTPLTGNDDLVVQVWSPDGVQVFRSVSHARLPQRAVLGFSNVRANGTTYRIFSIQTNNQTVQVAQDLAVRRSMASSLALRTLGPIAVMMPILMLVVWWVVSGSLEPVARVRKQLASRQADDLSPVSDAGLPDEVRPLVQELNLLFGRVRQAFDTQQTFVADAAHELRTPLAALKLQVQSLERSDSRADSLEARKLAVSRLSAGIERATRLVEQLLVLARQEASAAPHQPVVLADLAKRAVADLIGVAQNKHIDLGLQRADGGEVEGQPEALMILLRNLVDNAIKYTPAGGTVDVSVAAEQGAMSVTIEDSGPGIPAEERERVFDRFYRVPGSEAAGSGLGLAIIKAIAERHGATLVLGESERLKGLAATVRFPV
ncbi:histidine kinase [Massilia sp. WF1]|uniref:ATP-binding protein n=1 Tax=unclassified Massilia TaxID=2609279 RepID=UPI00064992D0|nr:MULTISPECIES: ATP-binding protein [unclassified Massilia]ALK98401.1 histidine kinase [Massilia sp. WG5]KLU37022.1 histidine kinase [Massilia sp. WF1]